MRKKHGAKVTSEIDNIVEDELNQMPEIKLYNSAFEFMSTIQNRHRQFEKTNEIKKEYAKHIPFVPSNSMKPAFICIAATTLKNVCCNFKNTDNMTCPDGISNILSTKALNVRRTLEVGTSFLTDGKQIILHFCVIKEKEIPVYTVQTLQNSKEFREYANSSEKQYLYPKVNFPDHGTFGPVQITRVIVGDPDQKRIIQHIVYEKNNGLFGKNAAFRTKG